MKRVVGGENFDYERRQIGLKLRSLACGDVWRKSGKRSIDVELNLIPFGVRLEAAERPMRRGARGLDRVNFLVCIAVVGRERRTCRVEHLALRTCWRVSANSSWRQCEKVRRRVDRLCFDAQVARTAAVRFCSH